MATRQKLIRFYRPILLNQKDEQVKLPTDFWAKFMDTVEKIEAPTDRVLSRTSGRYYGAVRKPDGGGTRYMRIGALRDRSDWPDTVEFAANADGLEALELDGERQLFESAYIVPFGGSRRIAMMGPIRGLVTSAGVGEWVSAMAGHDMSDLRIELAPEVDANVLNKLNQQALGLTRLLVRFPAGTDVEESDFAAGGSASRAIGEAVANRPTQASIEIVMSTGGRKERGTMEDLLAAGKQMLGLGADKLEVNMELPRGADDTVMEEHNVLKDQIAITKSFNVDDDETLTELSVLAAINEAIETFQQQLT